MLCEDALNLDKQPLKTYSFENLIYLKNWGPNVLKTWVSMDTSTYDIVHVHTLLWFVVWHKIVFVKCRHHVGGTHQISVWNFICFGTKNVYEEESNALLFIVLFTLWLQFRLDSCITK